MNVDSKEGGNEQWSNEKEITAKPRSVQKHHLRQTERSTRTFRTLTEHAAFFFYFPNGVDSAGVFVNLCFRGHVCK